MLLKATIKPKQPYRTELKSTTIYGAMCCAIANMSDYGVDILKNVIFDDPDNLVVSNAYRSGYIAAPAFKVDNDFSIMNTKDGKIEAATDTIFNQDHCMVSRISGASIKHWQDALNYSEDNLDIYIYTEVLSKDDIEKILKIMLLNGIGSRRSVGCGQFDLTRLIEIQNIIDISEKNQSGNPYYMVISDYIPEEIDSTNGVYTARIIRGKTIAGMDKKPLYVINAGSCFIGNVNSKSDTFTIGRIVHDEKTDTYTSGRALAVKLKM